MLLVQLIMILRPLYQLQWNRPVCRSIAIREPTSPCLALGCTGSNGAIIYAMPYQTMDKICGRRSSVVTSRKVVAGKSVGYYQAFFQQLQHHLVQEKQSLFRLLNPTTAGAESSALGRSGILQLSLSHVCDVTIRGGATVHCADLPPDTTPSPTPGFTIWCRAKGLLPA
jgi:hypothetical protein